MGLPSPKEMQLLALVATRERSGREVAKEYAREVGKPISYGTLYTTFGRMKDAKWVTVRESEDEDGRVRFFRISDFGAKALGDARDYYGKLAVFGLPDWRPA